MYRGDQGGRPKVYLSDMTTQEAVIFKQYDFRKSQPAKATFHLSFPEANRFHEAWAECPGRRSLECRVILGVQSWKPFVS